MKDGKARFPNEILDTITQAVDGNKNVDPYAIAIILIAMGEKHDAIGWLEQSYRRGSLWSLGFPTDPILQSLRDVPGYRAFLAEPTIRFSAAGIRGKSQPRLLRRGSSIQVSERGLHLPPL